MVPSLGVRRPRTAGFSRLDATLPRPVDIEPAKALRFTHNSMLPSLGVRRPRTAGFSRLDVDGPWGCRVEPAKALRFTHKVRPSSVKTAACAR